MGEAARVGVGKKSTVDGPLLVASLLESLPDSVDPAKVATGAP